MKTEAWWNLCKTVIAGILLAIAAVIGFRYLLPPLLPFILALVIASLIRPAAIWCKKHLGIGAKPVSVIMILAILFLLCLLFWTAGSRLIEECGKFLVNISQNASSPDSPIYKLAKIGDELKSKLPLSGEIGFDPYKIMTDLINNSASALAGAAGGILKKLPMALFATLVCFIALFYLTIDYEGAASAARELLPGNSGERLVSLYRRISHALWEYLRAYFLIMLVTFGELYLGFIILRVEYSLLFAVVIALVDFLPLLGVGTVMIPWGAGAFLVGNYRLGTGLFVIYGIVCLVRQFIEPKIVGDFIGTHPVIALAGVYAGLKLFGFAGMIAAPVLLYLWMALRDKGESSS